MTDSIILVVADTHLGLLPGKRMLGFGNTAQSDFTAFSCFLEWVKGLQTTPYNLPLGRWGNGTAELKAPDTLILLGDFLELWDASDDAIQFASRQIWNTLGEIHSRKIYSVGNHDFEMRELAGRTFPVAKGQIDIVFDHFPRTSSRSEIPSISVGSRRYLFIHGHQFDTTFRRISAWRMICYLRDGAETFGSYSWILLALAVAWSSLIMLGFSTDWKPVLLLLIVGALPRLFISVARPVYNRFFRTRYKPEKAVRGFGAWWKSVSKGKQLPRDPLFIVYGHTHMADILTKQEISELTGETVQEDLGLINVPAWVWDTDENYKAVFNDAALYIDLEGHKLIGWDWNKSRPFYIPDEVVRLRAAGRTPDPGMADELEKVLNWPANLLKKWQEALPARLRLASNAQEVTT